MQIIYGYAGIADIVVNLTFDLIRYFHGEMTAIYISLTTDFTTKILLNIVIILNFTLDLIFKVKTPNNGEYLIDSTA